ncbi:MAG: hypothetical protein HN759_01090 [Akkermansiaceae bacterium]|nr:hypothetical protein [Akkermansiaceae bacterium]
MKGKTAPNQPDRTSMASTNADLRELKTNSNATVRELKEFLSELRGKSPQEMLGVVASSQLFRAIILSLGLVTTTILLLTAIPYFFGEKPALPAKTESATTAPTTVPPTVPPSLTPDATGIKAPVELAPLGVNDKLLAPTNTNPLEGGGDDFLKDLE